MKECLQFIKPSLAQIMKRLYPQPNPDFDNSKHWHWWQRVVRSIQRNGIETVENVMTSMTEHWWLHVPSVYVVCKGCQTLVMEPTSLLHQ